MGARRERGEEGLSVAAGTVVDMTAAGAATTDTAMDTVVDLAMDMVTADMAVGGERRPERPDRRGQPAPPALRGVNAVGGMRGPVATAIDPAPAEPARPGQGWATPTGGSGVVSWSTVPSPVDELLLTSVDGALRSVWFSPHRTTPRPSMIEQLTASGAVHDPGEPVLAEASAQLAAYFAGRLRAFDLPLAPRGSSFQLEVWAALRTIPFGETWSYGDLAAVIGRGPAAARAVGLANGANPISIIVPCHRVIGADGSLTGFGGGLARKQYLLELESPSLFSR